MACRLEPPAFEASSKPLISERRMESISLYRPCIIKSDEGFASLLAKIFVFVPNYEGRLGLRL